MTTFACESARIDVAGAPLLDGLSCSAEGQRVGLVGQWQALFLLLAGRASLAAGRVTFLDLELEEARRSGAVAAAVRDPDLPSDWNVELYLTEAARLGGQGKRAARDSVLETLGVCDLGHLSGRRISTLTVAEKRALHVALALLDRPRLVAVEDPCHDLDERAGAFIATVVERAGNGRCLIVSSESAPETGSAHELFARADSVLALSAGALVAQGSLADVLGPATRYLVSVTAHGRELAELLQARGARIEVARPSGGFAPLDADTLVGAGGALRLMVQLQAEHSSSTVVNAAHEVRAPLLELCPIKTS